MVAISIITTAPGRRADGDDQIGWLFGIGGAIPCPWSPFKPDRMHIRRSPTLLIYIKPLKQDRRTILSAPSMRLFR